MDCKTTLRNLDVFRTGELAEEQRSQVQRHLSECPECLQDLNRLESFSGTALGLPLPAPAQISERVLALTGDRYGQVETELGPVWVGYTSQGIALIVPGGSARAFEKTYQARLGRRPRAAQVPSKLARPVAEAAAGQGGVNLPVDVSWLTEFQREVLNLLPQIPRGEVRPYSWLAWEAGRPRAVRAAANAVARNPVPFLIPCHRVVPLGGGVGKYAFGSAMKRRLLVQEGVAVEELERLARAGIRFIGSRTTKVYCFPACRAARRITARHRAEFPDAEEAVRQGYRPCLHCRPPAAGSSTEMRR